METFGLKNLYCYCHHGGELIVNSETSVMYKGVQTHGVLINQDTKFDQFVKDVCDKFGIDQMRKTFKCSMKFDRSQLVNLKDDMGMRDLIFYNDSFGHVYIYEELQEPLLLGDYALNDRSSTIFSNSVSQCPSSQDCSLGVDGGLGSSLMVGCASSERVPLTSSSWESTILGEGQTFHDANELCDALFRVSMAGRFSYMYLKNSRKFISVRCAVETCPWKLTASSMGNTQFMKVARYNNIHKHSAQDGISMQPPVRAKLISSIIQSKLKATPDYLPRQICKDFSREYAMTLTYYQSWRCKEKARQRIDGRVEDSYKLFPWLCQRLMQSNPGTVAKWTATDDRRFKQLFIAYGCSIHGFILGCRPLIMIDSSHLSGPYKGAMLSATTFDTDNCMFPITFGVVSSENYEDWRWFLGELRGVLESMEVVIVSDRHNSILASVPEVFGIENHAYCYRHIMENFCTYVSKVKLGKKKGKENAKQLLDAIAYARLDLDYNVAMQNLERFNVDLAKWVKENSPEKWANSMFPKKRWDKLNTNLTECFNSWLRIERHWTVFNLVNKHRDKLAELLYTKKEEMKRWDGPLGRKVSRILQMNIENTQGLAVSRYGTLLFMVDIGKANLSVDLEARECTCREWQMRGIPCSHACAAIQKAGFIVYDYVEEWYMRSAQERIYAELLQPVETHDMSSIDQDDDGSMNFLQPPISKRAPGRPREKRIESQFSKKRDVHCSRYNEPGHNRASCTNPI